MPDRPSRILYITYAAPAPARLGPARRHYHVLDQLSRFYEVHLASTAEPSEALSCADHFRGRVASFHFSPPRHRRRGHARKVLRTIAGRCDFLPVLDPGLRRLARDVTSRRAVDAIVLSSILLRDLPLPSGIPVVGDTHNAEFDVLRRTARVADNFLRRHYATRQWPSTRHQEQHCGRRVDVVLTTSDRDRLVFEDELGLRGITVIPNGIDLSEFAPAGRPPRPGTIVFSGLMSYYPNQQAVRWFLDEIHPQVLQKVPTARLVIAGAAPPRWLTARVDQSVEVTGWVPDIRPYLDQAAVVIAPLRVGGGTRVKILEAQATARPVVSTTLGAEGLNAQHDESILLADDAASFASCVTDVLSDRDLSQRIGANGRRHVEKHFDWNQIGATLSRCLESRIGMTARPTPLDATQARGRAAAPAGAL
jgi:glycosyltransferase involved in cell wall biosynthesis